MLLAHYNGVVMASCLAIHGMYKLHNRHNAAILKNERPYSGLIPAQVWGVKLNVQYVC